jgi:uncharacterized membrane protein
MGFYPDEFFLLDLLISENMAQIEKTEPNNDVLPPRINLSPHQLGLILVVLGAIELIIGIFSWMFTIPMFSMIYIGEIVGILFIFRGVQQLRKEK